MGIPKFFRFMSERYPLISQLIQENRIPEFDALYLDMNGIIHNCSHPNDDDATFRISEHDIFLAIFNYIAHLFAVIKPQKLFFLAIDGVAPRAKMNQQRSRRFRTAKEAKETLDKAKRRGEEIPQEAGFDSNCITPGTPFMARLSAQLKYFIAKKVSEDADWRGVEIILSGHEVPGEGEHKIMEYIRLNKAQPGYNPNMRHCMYGLDADLIMLGLLSHDPHFCLLREEVTFGPRGGKGKAKSLENQNFYLMHLSLFREYLDHEFSSLKSSLPFEYDLERIIDDFILINIFIGNDFLPHLPGLHINEGALNRLFEIYKRILPQAGGYLNEHGSLNTKRLQLVLNELNVFEREQFEHEVADIGIGGGRNDRHGGGHRHRGAKKHAEVKVDKAQQRGLLAVSESQKEIADKITTFVRTHLPNLPASASEQLQFPNDFASHRDRRFLSDMCDALKLYVTFDEFDDDDENVVTVKFDQALIELAREEEEDDVKGPLDGVSDESSEGEESSEAEEIGIVHLSLKDKSKRSATSTPGTNGAATPVTPPNGGDQPEWKKAVERVLSRYEKAEVIREMSQEETEAEAEQQILAKMEEWKKEYYREKLEFAPGDQQAVEQLVYRYIEGLQWVLRYYYKGVASWGWFYDYHYAPKMTDLQGADKFNFNFELGKPFRPFEQLMGVLPDLSSQHIPPAFRDLMSDPTSPIIDFYPTTFEHDMNGKKQEWEAIVKIPFIDEKRLLTTMQAREPRLTAEERARNSFGECTKFVFDDAVDVTYPSSLPGFFPDLVHNHTRLDDFHLPTLEGGLSYVKGLMPGVLLGKDAVSGFPSLHTIPHTASLGFHGVNVFQTDSRRETMIISTENLYDGLTSENAARLVVGKRVYVGYPYLREALVDAVSDELFRYELDQYSPDQIHPIPHTQLEISSWKRAADKIEHVYSKSRGCLIGHVEVVVHARVLKGLKRMDDGSMVKEWHEETEDFALQATVRNVGSEDVRYMERPPIPIEIEYPEGGKVFFLGAVAYGVPAQVMGHDGESLAIRIAFFPTDKQEAQLFKSRLAQIGDAHYTPSHQVSRRLGMSGLTLSKITSSLLLFTPTGDTRVNVGLNLKFEAKQQKVLGYSRKTESGWEFSEKAIELIREYKENFPEIIRMLDTNKSDLTHSTDFFSRDVAAERMKDLTGWIKEKGVRDFDKVPLFSEQLDKDAVHFIENLEDKLAATKTMDKIKQARIVGIPRQGVLKPAHAASRLRDQQFQLGDRVITVAETGSVPLSAKGVVVGIQSQFVDVVFDVQFMGGTTLGGRCSNYRGATVSHWAVLNLSSLQYATGAGAPPPQAPQANRNSSPGHSKNAKFRHGPLGGPAILPAQGLPAGGFHPSPQRGRGRGGLNGHVQVMQRGGGAGRSVSPHTSFQAVATGRAPAPATSTESPAQPASQQQRLGQTLGIRSGAAGGGHRGGFGHAGGMGGVGLGHHPLPFHPANMAVRGVPHASLAGRGGVAIPPPAVLQQQGPSRGRGRGRGGHGAGGRGGRGGAPRGGSAAAAPAVDGSA
ncbi:hypothetical protein JCM10908_005393 [Rhodotorula pacifica]|uniref:chromatin-binding exonuclease XRN1 n=1 Tax=Rhodotorula pacifica TaxID=1495444 RepID=UPI003178EB82